MDKVYFGYSILKDVGYKQGQRVFVMGRGSLATIIYGRYHAETVAYPAHFLYEGHITGNNPEIPVYGMSEKVYKWNVGRTRGTFDEYYHSESLDLLRNLYVNLLDSDITYYTNKISELKDEYNMIDKKVHEFKINKHY